MEAPELKNIKEITALFSEALRAVILRASPQLLESLSEIRLRAGMPVVLVTPKQTCFLQKKRSNDLPVFRKSPDRFSNGNSGYCVACLRVFRAQPPGGFSKRLFNPYRRAQNRSLRNSRNTRRKAYYAS